MLAGTGTPSPSDSVMATWAPRTETTNGRPSDGPSGDSMGTSIWLVWPIRDRHDSADPPARPSRPVPATDAPPLPGGQRSAVVGIAPSPRRPPPVIDPLPKGEPYPGRLPPLRTQWRRVSPGVRLGVILGPLLLLVILFAASVQIGTVAAVMVVGVWAATAVYVKNRTDRHNAAVDRGEIRIVADPHLQPVPVGARRLLSSIGCTTWDIRQTTSDR